MRPTRPTARMMRTRPTAPSSRAFGPWACSRGSTGSRHSIGWILEREIGPRAVSRTVVLRLARLSAAKAVAQDVAVLGELPPAAGPT